MEPTKLEQLRELQARLDKATGPNRNIDVLCAVIVGHKFEDVHGRQFVDVVKKFSINEVAVVAESWNVRECSSSIDAALAWVEKMLPGYAWSALKFNNAYEAAISLDLASEWEPYNRACGKTAPIAILKAAVAALIEKD